MMAVARESPLRAEAAPFVRAGTVAPPVLHQHFIPARCEWCLGVADSGFSVPVASGNGMARPAAVCSACYAQVQYMNYVHSVQTMHAMQQQMAMPPGAGAWVFQPVASAPMMAPTLAPAAMSPPMSSSPSSTLSLWGGNGGSSGRRGEDELTVPCPQCNTSFVRFKGVQHMRCLCGAVFCMLCRVLADGCGCAPPSPAMSPASAASPQPESRKCYKCDQPGHLYKSCPTIMCYACSQYGHMAANCPQPVHMRRPRTSSGGSAGGSSASAPAAAGTHEESADLDGGAADRLVQPPPPQQQQVQVQGQGQGQQHLLPMADFPPLTPPAK